MSSSTTNGSKRRETIADSAIRVIARDGVRALTHRAVDREAGIPQGSTSYHAKTRLALVELVVDALAARAKADAERLAASLDAGFAPGRLLDADALAALIAGLVEALASRRDDMRARYALLLELHDEPRVRAKLTADSDVHALSRRVAATALTRAGLPGSDAHVEDLIALTDSLLFHRTALDPTASPRAVLAAYLRGTAMA
ncbi:TetR family transcriptional regulator [Streptomyces sp. NPDC051771]|uniref:TetR/AcrR family transcriptional regulator n=1 Tax=Streptomyces sp. NPDC051771 TaxID=3154847 RepID=UPI00342E6903